MGRLQTARLENFIRRWGSIKGEGSVLSETLGDVFPVLDLENLTPENQLPGGWTTFWGFATVVAVAAQLQGVSLINPANSGNIVVVDQALVRITAAGFFTIGTTLPLFTSIAGTRARDSRAPALLGTARIGANSNVGSAATGLLYQNAGGVNTTIELPHGIAVLSPGNQFEVVNSTVNDTITVGFIGRARVAESSELSF